MLPDQLLVVLQNASSTAGDVQVSIVPFDRQVNMNTSCRRKLDRLDDWEVGAGPPGHQLHYGIRNPNSSSPATVSFEAWGRAMTALHRQQQHRTNPFGFKCLSSPTNSTNTTSSIPSSGTYNGYICPGQGRWRSRQSQPSRPLL